MTPAATPAVAPTGSLHADARARLGSWPAPTPEQEALRRRYVDLLDARADAMTRACRPDHLTASTLVLSADGSQVLLTLHAKAGRWFQLGGHCEPGDTTLAGAALREATEESGLAGLRVSAAPVQLSAHPVPFCGDGTALVHHLDVRYAALAPPEAVPRISDESLDLRWWPATALPDVDADLAELVARARQWLAGGGASGTTSRSASVGSSSATSGGGSTEAAADQPIR